MNCIERLICWFFSIFGIHGFAACERAVICSSSFSGQIQGRVLREFEVFHHAVSPVVEFDFQRLFRTGCHLAEQFGVGAKRRDEAVVEFRLHLFRHVGLGGGPLHIAVRPDLQSGRIADMGAGVVQDEVKMLANLAGWQLQDELGSAAFAGREVLGVERAEDVVPCVVVPCQCRSRRTAGRRGPCGCESD